MIFAGLVLAAANFLVVLDTTIANVSVSNIAGALAVSPSQGTWVITSYAVAEAVVVPLTGWLSARFGAVKVFVAGMIGFGLFSFLCGLAPSLTLLVLFRVLQGACGGPLMPLSQTLLLRVFPKKYAAAATGLWAMTTLVAPILGPILGGTLCDNVGWASIFWINVPVAAICSWFAWRLLRKHETPLARSRVDLVGLGLLIVWVGALQVMLDLGKEHDWFASPMIAGLAIVAAIGFVAFLIWELTDANPIVDLRVFRHRGFTASVITLSVAFGAFFGINVLTPLWLQQNMGYTATWAGYVSALLGVTAVLVAPLAAGLSTKVDPRRLGVPGRDLAGRDHLHAKPGQFRHGLFRHRPLAVAAGVRHAFLLRARDRLGPSQRHRAGDRQRRGADELLPHAVGRLRHLDGQHRMGRQRQPQPQRSVKHVERRAGHHGPDDGQRPVARPGAGQSRTTGAGPGRDAGHQPGVPGHGGAVHRRRLHHLAGAASHARGRHVRGALGRSRPKRFHKDQL
jgi:MFS family permease